jgi:hypothetical protein
MFGEGRHPDIARLFEHRLAPFMTQTSIQFWRKRLHYFRTGLYYQGGMVRTRGHHGMQRVASMRAAVGWCGLT